MAVVPIRSHSITSAWFVVIVITSFVIFSVSGRCSDAHAHCPSQCSCTNTSSIDCSGGNLSQIPDELPSTMKELRLDLNEIKRLSADDLADCVALTILNLSFNRLTAVDKSAFYNLTSLRWLDLSSNSIIVSELADETFDRLRSLQHLGINNNTWQNDSFYHGRLFSGLIGLQQLYVDGLPNQSFPMEFSRLRNLTSLTITGGINRISNETFEAFNESNILNLTIRTYTYLTAVEELSFAHFPQLDSLLLSKNRDLGIKNVAKAWYGLQKTNIRFLSVSLITNGKGDIQKVTSDFFRYLDQTRISVLILSNNDLVYIEPLFSTHLKYLTHVSLAGNRLYNPTSLIADFAKLQHLEVVQAGYQYCPSGPSGDDVTHLNSLESNRLGKVMKLYQSNNRRLDASNCRTYDMRECPSNQSVLTAIRSAELRIGEELSPVCFPLSPSVMKLFFNDGLFVYRQTLPPVTITQGGGNLSRIELESNALININGPIIFKDQPQNLAIVLNFNQIECLDPDVFKISFKNGAKITLLQLNMNNLGLQLERDVNGSTFRYYPFLEVLSLNYNGIKQLHNKTFRNLTELRTLSLSGNSLKDIDFEFDHMRQLELLDLSYNDLTSLNETMITKLSAFIEKNGNFSLALNGNPLQCTCGTLPFLRWMNDNRGNLHQFEENSCFFYDQYQNFSQLSGIIGEMEFECNKSFAAIISGILVGLVLILATLSVVCYRNRWEIRYAFIKLTQRGQRYQQLIAESVHYDYDAFVVYDSADRHWVNNELLPHLEGNSADTEIPDEWSSGLNEFHQEYNYTGLRLCVHERDFTPGEDIIGNIWNKMEKSRKVILVISKTFVSSNYCDYEVNLARMQSVELGRNILVPILLEMPEIERITDCLHRVLRKVTYLEWPRREEDQDQFWHKLRHTIADGS